MDTANTFMSVDQAEDTLSAHPYVDVNENTGTVEHGIAVFCDPGDWSSNKNLAIKSLLEDTHEKIQLIIKHGDRAARCTICNGKGHWASICQAFCTPCRYGDSCKRADCPFEHPSDREPQDQVSFFLDHRF